MDVRFPYSAQVAALCLAAGGFSLQVQAGVIINGTRVIYPASDSEITVQVTNNGKRPVLIQSWLDTGDSQATPDTITTPFVLTPPINRLDAGKAQSLRVTAVSAASLPQDRESLFWLNVLEIPGRPGSDFQAENYLQLAVRSRIKFFWRPASLREGVTSAPKSLSWSASSQGLKVTNPTPYYISLATVTIAGKTTEVDMVDPFNSRIFLDIRSERGNTIKAEWIDDYGAIRSQSFTVK